jgi:hypothetical protein
MPGPACDVQAMTSNFKCDCWGFREIRERDEERKGILNRLARESLEDGSYVGIAVPEGGEDE